MPSGEPTVTAAGGQGPQGRHRARTCRTTGVEVLNPEVHLATLEAGARVIDGARRRRGPRLRAADQHPAGSCRAGASRWTPPSRPIQRVAYNVENVAARQDHRLREADPRDLDQRRGVPRRGARPGGHATCATTSPRWRPAGATRRTRRPRRRRRGLPAGEPGQAAGGAAAARAGHQRAEERRDHRGRGPGAEDRRGPRRRSRTWATKSIDEIKTALAALGLSLGMRIDPNLLGALGRGEHEDEARQGGLQARAASPRTAGRCSGTCWWPSSATSGS